MNPLLPLFGDVGMLYNSVRLAYVRVLNREKILMETLKKYQVFRIFVKNFLRVKRKDYN